VLPGDMGDTLYRGHRLQFRYKRIFSGFNPLFTLIKES
jgi:hypothetical protein